MTRTHVKTRIHDVEATLRTLDAGTHDHGNDDDHASDRARADLERILATDPDPRGAVVPLPARPAPRRRLILAAGLVAAATAALLVLPSPFGGGEAAYATWTATPTGLSAAAAAQAGEDCRDSYDSAAENEYPQFENASVAIAERRGDFTTVVLAGEDGFSALCITADSDGTIGSYGVANGTMPGPRELRATSLGTGTLTPAGDLSMAEGFAGEDVTGVLYRSTTHGDVTATVNAGHFALWFPGDELVDAAHGVDVEVTYRDGSQASVTLSIA